VRIPVLVLASFLVLASQNAQGALRHAPAVRLLDADLASPLADAASPGGGDGWQPTCANVVGEYLLSGVFMVVGAALGGATAALLRVVLGGSASLPPYASLSGVLSYGLTLAAASYFEAALSAALILAQEDRFTDPRVLKGALATFALHTVGFALCVLRYDPDRSESDNLCGLVMFALPPLVPVVLYNTGAPKWFSTARGAPPRVRPADEERAAANTRTRAAGVTLATVAF